MIPVKLSIEYETDEDERFSRRVWRPLCEHALPADVEAECRFIRALYVEILLAEGTQRFEVKLVPTTP